jgi:hypothetical protein
MEQWRAVYVQYEEVVVQMELWSVYKKVVADRHPIDEEEDPDPH